MHAKTDLQHERSLSKHLTLFEKYKKVIRVLRDGDQSMGLATQQAEREQAIDQADIVVVLVTPDFWDVYDLALRAMARNKPVIPVLVHSTAWKEADYFGGFRPLPSNDLFIEDWSSADAAWLDVAQGLKRVWERVSQAMASAAHPDPRLPSLPVGDPPASAQPRREPPQPLAPGQTVKILVVAANPSASGRLQLGEEIRRIQDRVRQATHGSSFELVYEPELRVNQLAGAVMRHAPHIVHFSGHGDPTGAIMLVDPDQAGGMRPMSPLALNQLFSILHDNLFCVVLNACYSAADPQQAQALAEIVGTVVGMAEAVADTSALEFAASFYEALAFGRSMKDAFGLGKQAVLAMAQPGPEIPQLHSRAGLELAGLTIFRRA